MSKSLVEFRDSSLRCHVCNHNCIIPKGEVGLCGVRANHQGNFKLLVYGKPCAVWVDPIEKKPLFHYLPGSRTFSIGTYGCNFSCDFCQNFDISQAPHEAKKKNPARWRSYFEKIVEECHSLTPQEAVDAAIYSGCKSISFTYNEPAIFTEYALDIMEIAVKKHIRGIYITNGYETSECWEQLNGKINAVNIDLKAFTDRFYRNLCHASLNPVKKSIETAKEMGIWTEITTLIIPGENDGEEELKQMAEFLHAIDPEMPWHLTAFRPSYKMLNKENTPIDTLMMAREIGKKAGLKHVYCGNIATRKSECEKTICSGCGRILIDRTGFAFNNIEIVDGRCNYCKTTLKGVWS